MKTVRVGSGQWTCSHTGPDGHRCHKKYDSNIEVELVTKKTTGDRI